VTVLKKNIAANFFGSLWVGLMGLIFVPLYIHFIGIEAYGLIGIFATLLAIFGLLDMGLSMTLNREMARLAVLEGSAQEMRDLVRTLEIPYWIVGLLISIIVIAMSPFLAHHWVNAKNLSPKTVQTAMILMGLAFAFQWPMSFYSGGLMGLQRQVLLNVVNIVMSTFRGLGAVLILWLISPTVLAFFSWQIVISVVHVGLIVFFLWRNLPEATEAPRFRHELLRNIRRFAIGITGITVMATLLAQLDKVILSRMLSLEIFGYYSLAGVVAMTLYRFVGPVLEATYPQLTNLVALGASEAKIAEMYHKSAQLVSVLILPTALVVALFSQEIMLLWTHSPVTAQRTHLLVSILVIGAALNSILNIPSSLQWAYGWTRLTFLVYVVSALLLAPLMIICTKGYGSVGAATVWAMLCCGNVFIVMHYMHRRLLRHEKWRWYVEDVGRPLFASIIVAGLGRLIIRSDWSPLLLILSLGMVSGGTLLAAACVSSRLDAVERFKLFFAMIVKRVALLLNPAGRGEI